MLYRLASLYGMHIPFIYLLTEPKGFFFRRPTGNILKSTDLWEFHGHPKAHIHKFTGSMIPWSPQNLAYSLKTKINLPGHHLLIPIDWFDWKLIYSCFIFLCSVFYAVLQLFCVLLYFLFTNISVICFVLILFNLMPDITFVIKLTP